MPTTPIAWYNLGVIYRQSGHTADAITAFQQAIKLKPDHANAWVNLGVAYGDTGKATEAAIAFQRARELDPSMFK